MEHTLNQKTQDLGCPFFVPVNLTSGLISQRCTFFITKLGKITPQTVASITVVDMLNLVSHVPSVRKLY